MKSSFSSLFKALDVITLLTGHPSGLRMFEVVEYLNLPRPTVVRLLRGLSEYGLIEKDERLYRLSGRFAEWASPDRHGLLRKRHRPLLEAVAAGTGELVLLGVQEGNAIIHIDFIESDHAVRVAPAPVTRHNLQSSALGKLALSRTPHLRKRVSCARIERDLHEVDAHGIAWNREESNKGVIAMATWITTSTATAPMIAVAWPAYRFSDSAARKAVRIIRGFTSKTL